MSVTIDTVYILGVTKPISRVTLGSAEVAFQQMENLLLVKNVNQVITDPSSLHWEVREEGLRVDCLIDHVIKTEEACRQRKCVWDKTAVDDGDKCSLTASTDTGYVITSEVVSGDITVLSLSWMGDKKSLFSKVEDIIENITLEIKEVDETTLRVTVR
ncbi:hypothetical protein EB796_018708 [Bugula neritina]|uniref:Uncharacterized protein n=1 Tax=Bugula neritina TaxID=10212 RepID=A0A7J7JAH3_BUGNE|nr:hypothetical protein EB796_018708 [Bugula neritina]